MSQREYRIAIWAIVATVFIGVFTAILSLFGTPFEDDSGPGEGAPSSSLSSGGTEEPSSPSSSGQTTDTSSSAADTAPLGTLVFDALGGQPIINVYPGVGPSDLVKNGTYRHGQEVPALCIITGREVESDPAAGETPKESGQWVEIPAPSGERRFATLTYARLEGVSESQLPQCPTIE